MTGDPHVPDPWDEGQARAAEAAWSVRNRDPEAFERRVAALGEGPLRLFLLARVARSEGRLADCLELTRAAESRLHSPTIWRARVLETQGLVLNDLRLGEEAQRVLAEAWTIYRQVGDAVGEMSVQQNIGILYFQPEETSREIFRDLLVANRGLDAPDLRGTVLLNHQRAGAETGMSAAERMACAQEAYDLLRTSWPRMATVARCAQLDIAIGTGDLDTARGYAADVPSPTDVKDRMIRSHVAQALARFHLADGRPQDAVALLDAVLDTELEPDDLADLYDLQSRALAASGRFEDAWAMGRQAFDEMRELRYDEQTRVARALDAWHRTSVLREDHVLEQARADALEEALTELRAANRTIRELSVRDTVTGLHNRQYLIDEAPRVIDGASAARPAEIALVDLDHFKAVNDTYGHAVGDEVLRAVGGELRDGLDADDLVARYGGEEFVVVRPPHADTVRPTLCEDLDRLRDRVGMLSRAAGLGIVLDPGAPSPVVTMSVGVTRVRDHDLEAGLRRADDLMYLAKRRGRDHVLCDSDGCGREVALPAGRARDHDE